MKKILITFISLIVLFTVSSCSEDDQTFTPEQTNQQNFDSKNFNGADPIIEGCEVIFTFHSPNLTAAQKNFIRFSYGFVISYVTLNSSQERWYTDCTDLNTYVQDYLDTHPNHDPNNDICEPLKGCLNKCQSGTCSTSGGGNDPVDDPFGHTQN